MNSEEPKIGTTATDADNEDHEAVADEEVTINDVVIYTDLTPGKEYKLTGKLMGKETGEVAVIDGKELVSEAIFTPGSANGSETITFKFNGVELVSHDIVVFECLTSGDVEVAMHADINDENQTVKLISPDFLAISSKPSEGSLPKTGDDLVALFIVLPVAFVVCGMLALVLIHRHSVMDEDDAMGKEDEVQVQL